MSEEELVLFAGLPAILLLMSPFYLRIWAAKRRRELEHAERMKAMEMGLALPGNEPRAGWASRVWAGAAVAICVPTVTFMTAFLANLRAHDQEYAWLVAGVVGTIGIVGGLKLARADMVGRTGRISVAQRPAKGVAYDPDAYDVVSSRGRG